MRNEGIADRIVLWGRSMGGTTALMYAKKDPSITGLIVDSPFSRLSSLFYEIAYMYNIRLKKFLLKLAVWTLGRALKKRSGMDVQKVDVSKSVRETFVPALFLHGEHDTFVGKHHSEILHSNYSGDKNLIIFDGEHNSPRPAYVLDSISIFISNLFSGLLFSDSGASSSNIQEVYIDGGVLGHDRFQEINTIYREFSTRFLAYNATPIEESQGNCSVRFRGNGIEHSGIEDNERDDAFESAICSDSIIDSDDEAEYSDDEAEYSDAIESIGTLVT